MSDVTTTYDCPKHGLIKFYGYPPNTVIECRQCKDEALAIHIRDSCSHNGNWTIVDYYHDFRRGQTNPSSTEVVGIRMCTFCGRFEGDTIHFVGAS